MDLLEELSHAECAQLLYPHYPSHKSPFALLSIEASGDGVLTSILATPYLKRLVLHDGKRRHRLFTDQMRHATAHISKMRIINGSIFEVDALRDFFNGEQQFLAPLPTENGTVGEGFFINLPKKWTMFDNEEDLRRILNEPSHLTQLLVPTDEFWATYDAFLLLHAAEPDHPITVITLQCTVSGSHSLKTRGLIILEKAISEVLRPAWPLGDGITWRHVFAVPDATFPSWRNAQKLSGAAAVSWTDKVKQFITSTPDLHDSE